MILTLTMTLLAMSPAAAGWPPVRPLTKEYRFSDGQSATIDQPIVGSQGAPLYRLICRTWSTTESNNEFDYSGDFECRLVAVPALDWRDGWNLLSDEPRPSRDWEHRGRFLVQEFQGECLRYPGYGARRAFHLRGMELVLSLSDWRLEVPPPGNLPDQPGFRSFAFKVIVTPAPAVMEPYARAVPYDLPCCRPLESATCDSLDCSLPRPRGSLCPQAPKK
jgi:hypothetical protein